MTIIYCNSSGLNCPLFNLFDTNTVFFFNLKVNSPLKFLKKINFVGTFYLLLLI